MEVLHNLLPQIPSVNFRTKDILFVGKRENVNQHIPPFCCRCKPAIVQLCGSRRSCRRGTAACPANTRVPGHSSHPAKTPLSTMLPVGKPEKQPKPSNHCRRHRPFVFYDSSSMIAQATARFQCLRPACLQSMASRSRGWAFRAPAPIPPAPRLRAVAGWGGVAGGLLLAVSGQHHTRLPQSLSRILP